MTYTISRRQALGVLAAPLVAGCRGLDLVGPTFSSAASSAANGAVTLIGAGDQHAVVNANRTVRQQTAAMVKKVLDADPTAWAFNAGDLVFHGTAQEYTDCYHPSWGEFRERTLFTLGNHDRLSDPTGRHYYEYTGAERFYARTLGTWRCYVLNSEGKDFGGAGSIPQAEWLKQDIAQHPGHHIMAMWHIPMFSNVCAVHKKPMTWPGKLGTWWQILQDNGAEFVLSGHAHRWERFQRRLRDGAASSRGVRQFVLGTGGGHTMGVLTRHQLCEKFVVARGVARFDLYPDRYQWTFTDVAGIVRDSGSQSCRKVIQPA
jgi:acid phosphatase type 7